MQTPNAVVFHILTNDLKVMEPATCVDKVSQLIKQCQHRWNSTKVLISLATPRYDSVNHNTNGIIINALLKQKLLDNKGVVLIDHSNMLHEGNVVPKLLAEDKYHLSEQGVSVLASNIKRAIHDCLDIVLPRAKRNHSRSRSRISANRPIRGRGRGRGLMQIASI